MRNLAAGAALFGAIAILTSATCSAEDSCEARNGCFDPCSADNDCTEGEICRQTRWGEGRHYCTTPCSSSQACRELNECRCVAGSMSGFCDTKFDGPPSERARDELCPADFATETVCAALCACPCSFHRECPGSGTRDMCREGCAGAYTSFSACSAEIDAYYACAYRDASCVAGNAGSCPNGFPYCWGTPPESACPNEYQAVVACTKASWSFFYPSPS